MFLNALFPGLCTSSRVAQSLLLIILLFMEPVYAFELLFSGVSRRHCESTCSVVAVHKW